MIKEAKGKKYINDRKVSGKKPIKPRHIKIPIISKEEFFKTRNTMLSKRKKLKCNINKSKELFFKKFFE